MAAPFLLRGASLLRLRLRLRLRLLHQTTRLAFSVSTSRSISSSSADPTLPEDGGSSAGESTPVGAVEDLPNVWDEFREFRKSKEIEKQIIDDIEPIVSHAKRILHSHRYEDGEPLTAEDERVVVDRLLSCHPESEGKIGCGLHCIMVDKHPDFPTTRCLFVVRKDGGYVDFSYRKCVREYIRHKYPSHAESFIEKYDFRRGLC